MFLVCCDYKKKQKKKTNFKYLRNIKNPELGKKS